MIKSIAWKNISRHLSFFKLFFNLFFSLFALVFSLFLEESKKNGEKAEKFYKNPYPGYDAITLEMLFWVPFESSINKFYYISTTG